MNCYNDVVSRMNDGEVLIPFPDQRPELADWCDGYWAGLMLDDAWTRDDEAMRILTPVVELRAKKPQRTGKSKASAGRRRKHVVAEAVAEAHGYFRDMRIKAMAARRTPRRASNKVGRNDPCPCGSGRKYKQCCLKA